MNDDCDDRTATGRSNNGGGAAAADDDDCCSSYYCEHRCGGGTSNGFWSWNRDDVVGSNQLQKFWSELSPHARQDLLRIDKQTLFEQARKSMYCSRCNGLLLEGFLQIVMYGKSMQLEGAGKLPCGRNGFVKSQVNSGSTDNLVCQDELQDPSVHPWGGLTATRDGALTLLDCYTYSKSLKGLQNVFDSARARERERELLYPDACGGGGRGWISQGTGGYGRGHGTRETCALHTARLSCDTLVDFWSALGEETRQSLLRMKEGDFIERLMYRFDNKRFCRDCRRNVIREFKELKELKRMKKETRCTNWFCVADTAFVYEVSNDTIRADWHQTFIDSVGTYHHFEWAVGTGEGKSDILEFENVGMNGSVAVNGLDLAGLSACYITLKACRLDGRFSETSVKAHALKGHQCVHCRLMVGDGYVTITRGESIRRFFEHAEEIEEDEDDDSLDKDGNDLDGECSRPQKHAKSPELAREFLLDAATVIFKEQVEKAFREGTARQNAHSIFVCLSLKLLEERVHVACKEIVTLEKQTKLLEEEEKEKREEEERKERRRNKEKEKKLRRKERLRGKDKERTSAESNHISEHLDVSEEASLPSVDEEASGKTGSLVVEADDSTMSHPASPDAKAQSSSNDNSGFQSPSNGFDAPLPVEEPSDVRIGNDTCMIDSEVSGLWKLHRENNMDSPIKLSGSRQGMENSTFSSKSEARYYDEDADGCFKGMNGLNRQRAIGAKFNPRSNGPRYNQKQLVSSNRNDLNYCGCNQQHNYRSRVEPYASATRTCYDTKSIGKLETATDLCKPVLRGAKLNQTDYVRDNSGRSRSKVSSYTNYGRDPFHIKKVWEPVEPQKKFPRSNSDSDFTLRSNGFKTEGTEPVKAEDEDHSNVVDGEPLVESENMSHVVEKQSFSDGSIKEKRVLDVSKRSGVEDASCNFSAESSPSSSCSSDNCSSCTSEGDNNTASSNPPIRESSSMSDSDDGGEHVEESKTSLQSQNGFSNDHKDDAQEAISKDSVRMVALPELSSENVARSNGRNPSRSSLEKPPSQPVENGKITVSVGSLHQGIVENGKITHSVGSLHQGIPPPIHHQNVHFPIFQVPSTLGYYQTPVSWSTAPANGFVPYHHPNHYLFTSGYGMTGDTHFLTQYGAMHPVVSPLLNSGQIPVYQPVLRANGYNAFGESTMCKTNGGLDPSGEYRPENVVQVKQDSTETPASAGVENGFSLFQVCGPVALSTFQSNPRTLNEELDGDKSTKRDEDHAKSESECLSKKESMIGEYNLFASGIQFSIF